MIAIAAVPLASRILIIFSALMVSLAWWTDAQQRNQCQSVGSTVSVRTSLPEQRAPAVQAQQEGTIQSTADAADNIGIVGLKFRIDQNKQPQIMQVFSGTPAAKADLQKGDEILAIDGIPATGLDMQEVQSIIIGEPNTVVNIIIRRGTVTLKEKALIRTALKNYEKSNPTMWRKYRSNR